MFAVFIGYKAQQTAMGVWKALEADYQTKTLPKSIYLKQSFASFKMSEQKTIEENLNAFLKLDDDLASLNIIVSWMNIILTAFVTVYAPLSVLWRQTPQYHSPYQREDM